MRFVPVKLNTVNCTIFQTHGSNAFQLAPASCAERFTQPTDLADTVADGNRFDLFDTTDNFKVFNHRLTVAWLLLRSRFNHRHLLIRQLRSSFRDELIKLPIERGT